MNSSSTWKWTYDVFLSFRGEDTRNNFIDHLYTALVDRGIYTFKDDENLKMGKSISTQLLKAIEESRFAIVVFSKDYAYSSWCLNELVKIIDCKNSVGRTLLPVFYDVDPSDLRKQKSSLEEAFNKHQLNGGNDQIQIQRWRDALAEAANISGWSLKDTPNGHESKCIKQIVENILNNLGDGRTSSFSNNLIGIETRVRNVKSLLHTSSDDVQMLGIWGMGGSGKTTLAQAILDNISHQFEGRCFVANVRETSKNNGLQSLQEQILSDILMQSELKVRNIHEGKLLMSRLCRKRVIIVLDDVDDEDQLDALAGDRDWFGKGSKIIVTTRDEHLLVVHGVDKIHKVILLNDDESILLFNKYAFRGNSPSNEYVETSRLVRRKVDGHPLALKVLGSFLCGRSIIEWKSTLERLKHEPERKILDILKISFDSLKYMEKQMFLDLACFFIGYYKDAALEIFDSFDFHPDIGLQILVEKCLITISPFGILQMHDLIKELALDIVCQMNPHDPGRYSRLWVPEHICDVLTNDTGTDTVEGIVWRQNYLEGNISSFRGLKNMKKLRLLIIYPIRPILERKSSSFTSLRKMKKLIHTSSEEGGLEYLSHELCWLQWDYYPSKSLPQSFQPEKLVHLSMWHSNMVQLWNGKKAMSKLKFVDLSRSGSLIRTPDFSGAPNLEKLIICECGNLKEVHPSLGDLQRLTLLDLSKCSNLNRFTFSFNMISLEILNLSSCKKLQVFPQIEGDMKRLTEFYLDCTAIEEVHPSIEKLTGLVILNLNFCKNLRCLPSTIGCLKRLKSLGLKDCSRLKKLPDTLEQIESLENLHLNGSALDLNKTEEL